MLNFNEFAEYVEKNIKGALPESVGENVEVSLRNVKKNNDTELCGIEIENPEQHIAPILYLDDFYKAYQDGASLEECMCKIADDVVKIGFSNIPGYVRDIADELLDFEKIKDRIIVNVINTERNCKMLEEVPHTEVEDLSFIYKIMLTSEEHESATITIKNEHLALWNDVTLEKLHEVAFANSRRLLPVKVESMRNILMRMPNFDNEENDLLNDLGLHEDMGCPMYVISNRMFFHGAAAIFYSDALSKISEEMGENLYVLPSSVHEVIVVNEKLGTPEGLVEMVKAVNGSSVAIEEQLSDHVYCFCAETHEFKIADVA